MAENMRNVRLERLMEREKELNCLYSIESLLIDDQRKLEYILPDVVREVPKGWQYTTVCECRITLEDKEYQSDDYRKSEYVQSADIIIGEHVAGKIEVIYTQLIRMHKGSPFLPEEQKLLNTIAGSLGRTLFRRKLKSTLDYMKRQPKESRKSLDEENILNPESDQHWKWRWELVEKIASHLDLERFGLKGLYLIGSTKNANAGPGSDIDLIAHSEGNAEQDEKLRLWMEGWGYCLEEINYRRTGYRSSDPLIDLHIITDEDIRNKDSYAIMLTAVSDRARPIKVKN